MFTKGHTYISALLSRFRHYYFEYDIEQFLPEALLLQESLVPHRSTWGKQDLK